MKTSSAKNKGRRLQQTVRDTLLEHGRQAGLTEADIRSTSMGAGGSDLLLSTRALSFYPFAVECKNVERLNIWQALEQAANHEGSVPLVVFKKNRKEPHVALRLTDFMELVYGKKSRQ